MRTIDQIVEDFAREAKVDYVGLWQICNAVTADLEALDTQERRRLSIVVINKLLDKGLQAVDLAESGGCRPWKRQDRRYVIGRIESEWDELEGDPDIGDIVWFNALG